MGSPSKYLRIIVLTVILFQNITVSSLEINICGHLPTPLSSAAAVYDSDDSVYILGGIKTVNSEIVKSDEVLKYNLKTHQSKVIGNFPVPVSGGAAVMVSSGDIFYFGDEFNTTIYLLPADTYTPEVVAELEFPSAYAVAIAINESIFLIGGLDNENVSKQIIEFDIVTYTHSVKAELPYPLAKSTGILFNDTVYLFGGKTSEEAHGKISTILQFDPIKLEVEVLDDKLDEAVESAIAITTGEKNYIFGGYIGGDSSVQRVVEFRPNDDKDVLQEVCVREEDRIIPRDATGIYAKEYEQIFIFGGETHKARSEVLCIQVQRIEQNCKDENTTPSSAGLFVIKQSIIIAMVVIVALV